MSDFRMLVLDLDGTTLTEQGTLSEVDRRAAHRLKEAGITVTIATGRLFPGTQWVAKELGVQGTVAVMNGNELIDANSGELVSGHYLGPTLRHRVREVLEAHGLHPLLFGSRTIHYGAQAESHIPYLNIWSPELTQHVDVFRAEPWGESHDDIVAVCALGPEAAIAAADADVQAHLPHNVSSVQFNTFTGERFLSLSGATWNKGTAVKQMAQERGFTPDQVVAVGDWWNDEPMIRVAGRGYAMNHATDELKALADEVLDASREGGAIAEVAQRVWGLT